MDSDDASNIYFGCTSSSDFNNGCVGIWSLKDILESRDLFNDDDPPMPVLMDKISHLSPTKALAWNPLNPNLLITGGSTDEDSVLRLYDL